MNKETGYTHKLPRSSAYSPAVLTGLHSFRLAERDTESVQHYPFER